jgi:23S rRNA-/tRNA-specific pseudouridylate synthase
MLEIEYGKDKIKNYIQMTNFGSIVTITRYRLIKEILWRNPTRSLVELQSIIERTHQLRLHCFQNHVPIIGDRMYGDFNFHNQFQKLTGKNRMFLPSNEVSVHYKYGDLLKCFPAKSGRQFSDYCLSALEK